MRRNQIRRLQFAERRLPQPRINLEIFSTDELRILERELVNCLLQDAPGQYATQIRKRFPRLYLKCGPQIRAMFAAAIPQGNAKGMTELRRLARSLTNSG